MKRFIAAMLTICVLFCTMTSLAQTDKGVVRQGEGWEITKEYSWKNYGDYKYAFVLKNTSNYNARISVNVVFYDGKDNIVGVSSRSEYGCESGYETYWGFSNDIEFSRVDIRVTMEKENRYEDGGQSSIKLTANKVGDRKIILIAENIGKEAVKFVQYDILYLKNGKVVSTDWGYLVDKDNEIKPGAMEMGEETGYEDFSEFQVYIHGTID